MRLWRRSIPDPLYGHGFEFLLGGTRDDVERYIRRSSGDDSYRMTSDHAVAATVQLENSRGIHHWIWLQSWSGRNIREYSRLVHECFHHTRNVMALIGCEDDEAHAYYLEYVFGSSVEALRTYRRR
jgi:hypothetical protein